MREPVKIKYNIHLTQEMQNDNIGDCLKLSFVLIRVVLLESIVTSKKETVLYPALVLNTTLYFKLAKIHVLWFHIVVS